MKFRLWSDVHNEFSPLEFHPLDSDKDTTLIIAGDWSVPVDPRFDLLESFCNHFKHVVFVTGNHDYWDSSFKAVGSSFIHFAKYHSNFHYLNPGVVTIDDTFIIGTTLWTDCNKEDPVVFYKTQKYMQADFSKIEEFRTDPELWLSLHSSDRRFIAHELNFNATTRKLKCLIVTHHAPHAKCDPEHPFNAGFVCADMDELINPELVNTWAFGHTHVPVDFELNGVRMISNPRGYVGFEELPSQWNDAKIYEV